MGINELEVEISKLPLKERALLAKWIMESLDTLPEEEIETLWVEEAERRLDEMDQGLATNIPVGEVLSRARAAIA